MSDINLTCLPFKFYLRTYSFYLLVLYVLFNDTVTAIRAINISDQTVLQFRLICISSPHTHTLLDRCSNASQPVHCSTPTYTASASCQKYQQFMKFVSISTTFFYNASMISSACLFVKLLLPQYLNLSANNSFF